MFSSELVTEHVWDRPSWTLVDSVLFRLARCPDPLVPALSLPDVGQILRIASRRHVLYRLFAYISTSSHQAVPATARPGAALRRCRRLLNCGDVHVLDSPRRCLACMRGSLFALSPASLFTECRSRVHWFAWSLVGRKFSCFHLLTYSAGRPHCLRIAIRTIPIPGLFSNVESGLWHHSFQC